MDLLQSHIMPAVHVERLEHHTVRALAYFLQLLKALLDPCVGHYMEKKVKKRDRKCFCLRVRNWRQH